MRVLAVGGAGEFGKLSHRSLVSSPHISEVVIAGRNLAAAEHCAAELGEKARAVSVDVSDREKLVALAKESDIVVNTAAPEFETVLKVLRAAILAGTDYCDIGADGPTTQKALDLDSAAKSQGITALLGIGACPGICSLMMMHAAHQLDKAVEVDSCGFFQMAAFGITKDVVRRIRESGRIPPGWQMLMKWATPPFYDFSGGSLKTVQGTAEERRIRGPGIGEIPAMLAAGPEAFTIPRSLPGVRDVHMLLSWFPSRLHGVYRDLGRRVQRGELDWSQAALRFLEEAVAEQESGPTAPTGVPVALRWAEATGTKNGERRRYLCWPNPVWMRPNPTSVSLAIATLKILTGEIQEKGVLTPEICLEPLPFFQEVARWQLKKDETGPLLSELWETL